MSAPMTRRPGRDSAASRVDPEPANGSRIVSPGVVSRWMKVAACGFPVHVEVLIVTVIADDVIIKNQPHGVTVVPRMQVAKWLLRHGDILTADQLDAVYEVARRSTTWQP